MSHDLYLSSVPVFRQMLLALSAVLAKGEAHAEARNVKPEVLLQARLAIDMLPLVRQVQVACDFANSVSARLAGIEVRTYEDNEQSLAELKDRIAKTVDFLDGLTAAPR